MNSSTVSLILALIPIAEKLVFQVGGKLVELNTKDVSQEDLLAALEESQTANWPKLSFKSSNQEVAKS